MPDFGAPGGLRSSPTDPAGVAPPATLDSGPARIMQGTSPAAAPPPAAPAPRAPDLRSLAPAGQVPQPRPPLAPAQSGADSLLWGGNAAAPAAAPAASPAVAAPGVDLVPIGTRPGAARELVAALLNLPQPAALPGKPLTLREALGSALDRPRQLDVTHAYWRLTDALGAYRAALNAEDALSQLQARAADTAILRTATTAATAATHAARLAALRAQYDLAEAVALPSTSQLPLPADLPHTGDYRTYYEELSRTRTVPAATRLVHRTLPLRREALEMRASAVDAVRESLAAARQAYETGHASLSSVVTVAASLAAEERALVASACAYNHDIADYALAIVGPQISGDTVVSMLIKTTRPRNPEAGRGGASRSQRHEPSEDVALSAVTPATHEEPLAAPAGQPARRPGVPTPAPPRPAADLALQPTPAPSKDSADGSTSAQTPDPATNAAAGAEAPAAAPDADAQADFPTLPDWTLRSAERQPLADTARPSAAGPLYADFAAASPAARAKQLTLALYWRGSLPQSQPVELKEVLRDIPDERRRDVIKAYWTAARRAAEYQVFVSASEMLEGLASTAASRASQPLGKHEVATLTAARLAARARLVDAEAKLIEAQFDLARQAGRNGQSTGLLPSTTPHAGPYLLKLEAQPASLAGTWPMQRLAATVPALGENLQERSAAVVEADATCAAAAQDWQTGQRSLVELLALVDQQTAESLAFLDTLTQYNEAIADYVLRVVPPAMPGDRLVASLVLAQ